MMRDKIAKWYAQKLWNKQMVLDAVEKGVISESDYKQIVSKSNFNEGLSNYNGAIREKDETVVI